MSRFSLPCLFQRILLLLYLFESDWRVHASVRLDTRDRLGHEFKEKLEGEAPDSCSFTGGPLGVSIAFYLKGAVSVRCLTVSPCAI